MAPNHFKLLIHEGVALDAGTDGSTATMDELMKALGAVRRRTEADRERLSEIGGLRG